MIFPATNQSGIFKAGQFVLDNTLEVSNPAYFHLRLGSYVRQQNPRNLTSQGKHGIYTMENTTPLQKSGYRPVSTDMESTNPGYRNVCIAYVFDTVHSFIHSFIITHTHRVSLCMWRPPHPHCPNPPQISLRQGFVCGQLILGSDHKNRKRELENCETGKEGKPTRDNCRANHAEFSPIWDPFRSCVDSLRIVHLQNRRGVFLSTGSRPH